MKLILIAFTIIELLFILFNDIPYLTNPSSNAIWNDSRFFVLHLLTLFVSIIGFGLIKVLTKYKERKYENICKLVISILTILLLSLIAMINVIDQVIHTNISSVFIANLIVFNGFILLSFPLDLAVYLVPFLTYLGGLIVFQHNIDLLISNSINGFVFFLAAGLISTVIYNYHYEVIAKNIVLEETNFKLDYMSNHDPLTRLLNRRSFGIQVAEKVKIIAENIRLEVQNKVILTEKFEIQITASFGISLLKDNLSNSFDTSYKAADNALYQAKDQGRNKVIIASSVENTL